MTLCGAVEHNLMLVFCCTCLFLPAVCVLVVMRLPGTVHRQALDVVDSVKRKTRNDMCRRCLALRRLTGATMAVPPSTTVAAKSMPTFGTTTLTMMRGMARST